LEIVQKLIILKFEPDLDPDSGSYHQLSADQYKRS